MPKTAKPKTAKKKPGKSGFIAAIIINLILLFVFNSLLNWGVPFLTSDYSGVLWAINLSIGATIIANILFLVYEAGWFRHLAQLILNVIALFVVFLIYSIFPFTFTAESWAFWIKITLIIIMAGIGIAIIVEIFRLILRKN
jgi:hypothetical protein